MIAERVQAHSDAMKLNVSSHSEDHQVVLRVEHLVLLGDDAYLAFVVDNRGDAPFAVAQALVSANKAPVAAQSATLHTTKPAQGLGLVPAKSSLAGVIALRDVAKLQGKRSP